MDDRELYFADNFTVVSKNKDELGNSLQDQMIAIGKALLKAKKKLTTTECKLLIMSLTKIRWNKECESNVVEMDKKEIAEILKIPIDKNLSVKLRRMFRKMMANSMVSFDTDDPDVYEDGMLIIKTGSTKGSMKVTFNMDYMPLLSNLLINKNFVTIWANDIYQFNSNYSYLLFEELRLHSDTTCTNWRTYSTKQLKELFGIPKDGKGSYMHYDAKKEKEVFDRSNFEKKVLDLAISEINRGKMLTIYPIFGTDECKKGKCYEKIKKYGIVTGYQFKYVVKTRTVPADGIDGQMELEEFI